MNHYEERFKLIIQEQKWLMDALKAVRSLGLPDWYIAAGAIRNTVWDYLHGLNTKLNDIDVVYFDLLDLGGLRERESELKLKKFNFLVRWEVVNQARGHLFKHGEKIRPLVKSSYESIAYWSETSTCVGVRLEENDLLTICAPHGLSDLMELIVKPVPEPYRDIGFYKQRIAEKKWDERWTNLKIKLS